MLQLAHYCICVVYLKTLGRPQARYKYSMNDDTNINDNELAKDSLLYTVNLDSQAIKNHNLYYVYAERPHIDNDEKSYNNPFSQH